MARTSGAIFPVTGLQRAARYLVSIALMILWMMVRSSSRVSNFVCLLYDVYLLRLQSGTKCRLDLGQGCPGLVADRMDWQAR